MKDPPTSTVALSPKIIPFGFIKNRLATPSTPKVPRISEILSPVTRENIFFI
jgi:hypothetical protein